MQEHVSTPTLILDAAQYLVQHMATMPSVTPIQSVLAGIEGAMLVSRSYATASWFEAAGQQMLARLQASPSRLFFIANLPTSRLTRSVMNFQSKVALITGGATGIGKAVAKGFLARGASVVLNARKKDALMEAAAELDPSGEKVAIVAGDIGFIETAQRLVATAVERFGGVDILINNAGIFRPTPFLQHTEEDLAAYISTILSGTFFASQVAIPEMIKRGGGQSLIRGRCGPYKPLERPHPAPILPRWLAVMPLRVISRLSSQETISV